MEKSCDETPRLCVYALKKATVSERSNPPHPTTTNHHHHHPKKNKHPNQQEANSRARSKNNDDEINSPEQPDSDLFGKVNLTAFWTKP